MQKFIFYRFVQVVQKKLKYFTLLVFELNSKLLLSYNYFDVGTHILQSLFDVLISVGHESRGE